MWTLDKEHIFFAILVLCIGAFFWSSVHFQETFQDISIFFEGYMNESPVAAAIIFIVLGAIAIVISPFSSAPLIPVVVTVWGETLTIVLLVVGWFIGGAAVYFIGRALGAPILSKSQTFQKVDYYRTRISKKTEFGLVLLFRFAIPSEIAGYVLGIVRYHFIKYLATTLIYETLFATSLVYLSDALVSKRPLLFVSLLSVVVIIMGASLYFLRKKIKNHSAVPR